MLLPAPDRTVKPLGDKGAIVMTVENVHLQQRWREFREVGAVWDWDSYKPHITLTWSNPGVDINRVKPFPGEVYLGPERFRPVDDGWQPQEVAMSDDLMDNAVVIQMPAIIKARPMTQDGRRLVEVEASCEAVDDDGDVILQEALLGSAQAFIATGHLDLDHLSEFGARLGLTDPTSYIVGRPTDVRKADGKRTWVMGEIRKSLDGVHDPLRHRYDDFWDSLQSQPPVVYFASVYGYPVPGGLENCSARSCSSGATRFIFKALDWRSLAFTRNPKNTFLKGAARVIAAKSYLAELVKSYEVHNPLPTSMDALWAERGCAKCAAHKAPTLLGYRQHFIACVGMTPGTADIMAHAVMHRANIERILKGRFDIGESKSVAA